MTEEKQVWRSIKLSEELASEVQKIADKERRSFSAQALVFIEKGLKSALAVRAGKTQIDMDALGVRR